MEMPILSKNFFEIYKPDTGFFSKYQNFGKWSSLCLPVYEWQGALFVGCLELPDQSFFSEFSEKFPGINAVPVMCDSESLKNIWSELSGSTASSPLENASLDLSPSIASLASDEGSGFETLLQDTPGEEVSLEENSTSEEKSSENMDLGFVPPSEGNEAPAASSAPSTFNFSGASLMKPHEQPAPPPPTIETTTDAKAIPKEEKAPLPKPSLNGGATPPPASKKLNPNAFDLTSPSIRVQQAQSSAGKASPITSQKTIPQAIPSASLPQAKGQPKDLSETTKTGWKAAPSFDVPKKATPTSAEVLYTKPGALSSNKELVEKQKAALESMGGGAQPGMAAPIAKKKGSFPDSVFSEFNYHFKKTMILLVDGDAVKPWKWDAHFQKGPSQIEKFDLKNPSAFRVVMKTQKPYHGYVVSNEITDKFFDDWNSSQTPEHLTVVPVVTRDNVVAMILSIGEKSADNKASLTLAEKVAKDVSQQLENHPELLKAS